MAEIELADEFIKNKHETGADVIAEASDIKTSLRGEAWPGVMWATTRYYIHNYYDTPSNLYKYLNTLYKLDTLHCKAGNKFSPNNDVDIFLYISSNQSPDWLMVVRCKKVLMCPLIKSLGWPESNLKISSRSNEGAINSAAGRALLALAT